MNLHCCEKGTPFPIEPLQTELLNANVKNIQSIIEKQIETLILYKKSLIHEVITGKKQVYFGKKDNEN
jgi:hypothetical protein